MLQAIIVLFVLAALAGAYLASRLFKGQQPPWSATAVHGLLAASGLVLLLVGVTRQGLPATLPLVLMLLAAVGGFVLVSFHIRGKAAPKALIAVHALVAAAGLIGLLMYAFGGS